MERLKDLIIKGGRVWFEINEKDKEKFLQYAKDNGCRWMNGDEIQPQKDNCGCRMGINDLQLGFVPAVCWFLKIDNKPRKIKFKDLLEEI